MAVGLFSFCPDHPEIRSAELTGYPSWSQPKYCERCGEELGEDVYADLDYDNLCEDCLLDLHRKAR